MKEALRLALGALQRFIKYDYNGNPFDGKDVEGAEAITAIKEALAQPEQEPVAFASHGVVNWIADKQFQHEALLYSAPQRTWVGLTDEEIYSLADSLEIWNEDDEEWILDPNTFARAIEAAHGIKEIEK